MDKLNQLTENELYDLIVKSDKLTDIRPFVTIAQEFDENIYTQDWKTFSKEFTAAKNRDQKNKLKESLATKIAKLIFANIELEQEEEYHSPTAEETQREADKLKKKLGLPTKKASSPKKVSPKKVSPKKVSPKKVSPKKVSPKKVSPKKVSPKKVSPKKVSPKKAVSPTSKSYNNMLKRYLDKDREEAKQKLEKAYTPEKYFKVLEKMKKEKSFEYLEELDKDTDEKKLLNALIYHYLKDLKKIKSRSPKSKSKSKSKSPKTKPKAKSIYIDLVNSGYSKEQKEEAKKYILKAIKTEDSKKLLKYLNALQTQKGVVLLEELDKDTDEEILLNASIYHTLKDVKKVIRSGPKLEYLQQLFKGKPCDLKKPCDKGDCDLNSMKCLDETKEDYYENMERRLFNGKYFLGTKETLDKAFPVSKEEEAKAKEAEEAKKASKKAKKEAEAKKAKPESKEAKEDEEEVDLDVDVKDLGKLSELQRALIECLMPAGK